MVMEIIGNKNKRTMRNKMIKQEVSFEMDDMVVQLTFYVPEDSDFRINEDAFAEDFQSRYGHIKYDLELTVEANNHMGI